MTVQFSF